MSAYQDSADPSFAEFAAARDIAERLHNACRVVRLPKRALLTVEGGPGVELFVDRGSVWLTQDRDTADYFVGAGESMRLTRRGAAVISALRDSTVRVVALASIRRDVR